MANTSQEVKCILAQVLREVSLWNRGRSGYLMGKWGGGNVLEPRTRQQDVQGLV